MRINYAFIVKLGWHRVPWGRTRRPGGGRARTAGERMSRDRRRIHQTGRKPTKYRHLVVRDRLKKMGFERPFEGKRILLVFNFRL
jgi:hypothetical protein